MDQSFHGPNTFYALSTRPLAHRALRHSSSVHFLIIPAGGVPVGRRGTGASGYWVPALRQAPKRPNSAFCPAGKSGGQASSHILDPAREHTA